MTRTQLMADRAASKPATRVAPDDSRLPGTPGRLLSMQTRPSTEEREHRDRGIPLDEGERYRKILD